jgi:hypothetical protein
MQATGQPLRWIGDLKWKELAVPDQDVALVPCVRMGTCVQF